MADGYTVMVWLLRACIDKQKTKCLADKTQKSKKEFTHSFNPCLGGVYAIAMHPNFFFLLGIYITVTAKSYTSRDLQPAVLEGDRPIMVLQSERYLGVWEGPWWSGSVQ